MTISPLIEIKERTESVHFPVIYEFGHETHNRDVYPREAKCRLRLMEFKWNEKKRIILCINSDRKSSPFSVFLYY